MIHYYKVDISKEGNDLEITNKSRKYDTCGFHFFIEKDLKYHLSLFTCNECSESNSECSTGRSSAIPFYHEDFYMSR